MSKNRKHSIVLFLKFGNKKNILDLYENGTIYLNTIDFFRKIEDEDLRGDSYEGAVQVINSLPGTFTIPGIDRKFKFQKLHLKKYLKDIRGNIYSLYCVSSFGFPNPIKFKVDPRNYRFGTHCLMIKDVQYFMDKIQKTMDEKKLKYYHGFVKYYDKNKDSKELTLFDKPLEFEYQKEFRFYVESDTNQPMKIQIGSLRKYAELFNSKDMSKLKLVPNSD